MNFIRVLYEDAAVAVIEKPCGLLTTGYPGSREKTALGLYAALREKRCGRRSARTAAAVHRLDRDTSGILLIALTADARRKIMNSWREIVRERIYRALAENPANTKTGGLFGASDSQCDDPRAADCGVISAPLALNANHHSYVPRQRAETLPEYNRMRAPRTKEAVTHFRVLCRGRRHTMFELSLETGRTNQIRAHLAAAGYVIAGDTLYRAQTNPFRRLCLHARTLSFIHPYTEELLSFESAEPPSWEAFARR
ncbi:MAG: RluA family pseudouridine synthase [Bacteroides sp.]|nr:RluA family pseudouridine synthase [Prevotella sp.]MCM1407208.1 RluA family pseudouridine synthase [Treponema brennaborense]MCM1470360.1 RluA family pseudouridine synthase [Bacteroides sp.]